jgi:hypothetical protein
MTQSQAILINIKFEWLKGINKEMETVLQIGVFEDVPPEITKLLKPFKSRLVFKVKIVADLSNYLAIIFIIYNDNPKGILTYETLFPPSSAATATTTHYHCYYWGL